MTVPSRRGLDVQAVLDWIADDPDPLTRAELQELLERAETGDTLARDELEDRFSGQLEFGTAGLRGAIAAGPNRMNRAVVIRAAAGLSAFLDEAVGRGFSVVIGCDARYGSVDFAKDTAAVVTAAGGRAMLLPPHLPTPVTAFSLLAFGADAAVMVTASHNPPQDNGYKVYLGEAPQRAVLERLGEDPARAAEGAGAQIVPPFDAMIAERIAAVPSVAATPRADEGWETLGPEVVESYLQSLEALGDRLGARASGDLRIVLTSLHGVGGPIAVAALERAGFSDVHVVDSQAQPDPDFPTVAFPNPEEHGALDAAYALAREIDADLVVANDPDADRFSAAIPVARGGAGPEGEWYQLTGDEVGLLLGEAIASAVAGGAEAGAVAPAAGVLASSIVSSRSLAAVARAYGLSHTPTLTGFKWITRAPGIVFGYEEALGYSVDPAVVRDKDGISAAVLFCALASRLASEGRTIADELTRIRTRDGVYATAPLTFRLEDLTLIPATMDLLRTTPPAELGGAAVTRVVDLAHGTDLLPPTEGIALFTETGDRVVVRPSGTEPKLKCYLEAVEGVSVLGDMVAGAGAGDGDAGFADAEEVAAALSAAERRLGRMREDLAAHLGL